MDMPAHYAIEFLERFERLSRVEQDKVIIHELMHIPKTFGGGFRQHNYVCEENVFRLHAQFVAHTSDESSTPEKRSENASSFIPQAPPRRLPRFF